MRNNFIINQSVHIRSYVARAKMVSGNRSLKRGVTNAITSVGTWLAGRWALNGGARSIQVALYRVCTAIIRDLVWRPFKTGGRWTQVVVSTGFTVHTYIATKFFGSDNHMYLLVECRN